MRIIALARIIHSKIASPLTVYNIYNINVICDNRVSYYVYVFLSRLILVNVKPQFVFVYCLLKRFFLNRIGSLLRMTKNEYSMVAQRPVINISQGVVCGVEETLPNRESFYSFKGIPYAEPPIGELRFEVCVLFFV